MRVPMGKYWNYWECGNSVFGWGCYPLSVGDGMFEKESNIERIRAKRWREPMS